MLGTMSNRRRTRPARKDVVTARAQSSAPSSAQSSAQSDGQLDEDPGFCDCPACTAEAAAPVLFEMLIGDDDPPRDPVVAECGMAMLLTLGQTAGTDHAEWCDEILADLVEAGTTQAAGMIAALASLSEGPARAGALAAIANGPGLPDWARELVEPLTAVRCLRLEDKDEDVWALAAEFSRGDKRHAFVLLTEPDECGAAADLVVCEPDELPTWLKSVKQTASDQHYRLKEIALDPAGFRAEAEAAMAERRAHDAYDLIDDDPYVDDDYTIRDEGEAPEADAQVDPDPAGGQLELDLGLDFDDTLGDWADEPPEDLSYYTLLPVFQARLKLLPRAGQTQAAATGEQAPAAQLAPGARATGQVMRLRIDIKGSKPPIWRRLEVPADLTLARLHDVIQTSFGWTDSHLHVFETGRGQFGMPDSSLGISSDARVTLDRVVAQAGDKISYTYDFGDDWQHVIKVEQVLPPEPGVAYPRCTGGRRAGPPEDCGGIWGYEWLLDVIADPAHEEHRERLDWLGIDNARQFHPEAFDPDGLSKALSARSG